MKRQEMVNQISDNVITSFFPNMELSQKNLLADAMLTEAEKLGMMPPVVTGPVQVEKDGEELVVRPWRWED